MDKYTVKKELGQGGFGTAELVERKSDKTLFVIKTMVFYGDEQKEKFARREVEILQKARHYNVVRFHEHWFLSTSVRIVLAYCEGGDLGEAIRQQRLSNTYFDDKKVLDWMSQLLFGLKYLHDIKVIHRDLKPGNLLLCSNHRRLFISDFGLSRLVKGRGLVSSTGIGTIGYMAPELFQKYKYTTEVDIWATGCIIHKLVNLSEAFSGDTKEIIMNKIINSTFDKPRRRLCADIVEKCLQKKGNDRPEIEELIDLVDDIIEQKAELDEDTPIIDDFVKLNSTSCTDVTVKNDETPGESSNESPDTNSVDEVETLPSSQLGTTLTRQTVTRLSSLSSPSLHAKEQDELPQKSSSQKQGDSNIETSVSGATTSTEVGKKNEKPGTSDKTVTYPSQTSSTILRVQEADLSNIETSVIEVYKHRGSDPKFLWTKNDNFCSFNWNSEDAYLTSLTGNGHSKVNIGKTVSATLRSDGKVVTGNTQGEVFLWFNDKKLQTKKVHKKTIWQMCGLSQNRTFTASEDGTVNVLGPDFEILSQMEGSKSPVDAIANYKNTIATGNQFGKIWFYDLDLETKPKVLTGHFNRVSSLAFKNEILASGSDDSTIKLWRPKERDQPVLAMKHDSFVTAVVFGNLASESKLFSCSWDKTTAIWNIETGQKLNLIKHPNLAWCLDIHSNGYLAATGHRGVSLSDIRAPKIVKEIEGPWTWKVKFSPDGNRLGITERYGGSVKIRDIRF